MTFMLGEKPLVVVFTGANMANHQRILGIWRRDKYLWLGGFGGHHLGEMLFLRACGAGR
jgi:hypothetical protein